MYIHPLTCIAVGGGTVVIHHYFLTKGDFFHILPGLMKKYISIG